jgi:hypothetical protein
MLAAAAASLACGVVDASVIPRCLDAGDGRMWRVHSQCQQAAARAIALLPLPLDSDAAPQTAHKAGHEALSAEAESGDHVDEEADEAELIQRERLNGARAAEVVGVLERVCRCLRAIIAGGCAPVRPGSDGVTASRMGGEVTPVVAGAAVRALGRLAVRARRRRLVWLSGGTVSLSDAVAPLRSAAVISSMASVLVSGAPDAVLAEAARTLAELGAEGRLCLTEVALHGMFEGSVGRLSGLGGRSGAHARGRRMVMARAHAARALAYCEAQPLATLLLLASGGSAKSPVPRPVVLAAGRAIAASGVSHLTKAAVEALPYKRARFASLAARSADCLGFGVRGSTTCSRLAEAIRSMADSEMQDDMTASIGLAGTD